MQRLYIGFLLLIVVLVGSYYMVVGRINLSKYFAPEAQKMNNPYNIPDLPTPKPERTLGVPAPSPLKPALSPAPKAQTQGAGHAGAYAPRSQSLPLLPTSPPVTPMPAPTYVPVNPPTAVHTPLPITAPVLQATIVPLNQASPTPTNSP